ncbi:MAG TPA: hypothetical protein VLX68_13990 [Chitinivibrionales bacterium]|nr:hypothetical protein [Chitinivibrionales bacterium]
MKRLRLFAIAAVAGISLMMVGCAKEPMQEEAAAKAAVDAAKAAQADKYVASDFMALQASLTSALDDIQAQKKKSPMSRNYEKAKASLVSITAKAAELKAKAAEEMAKVQTELETTLATLTADIAKAKDMLKKPPKAKKAKAQFQAKVKIVADAEAKAASAQSLKASGDLAGALDAAKAGIATLESAKAEPAPAPAKAKAASKPAKHKGKKRK